MNKAVRQTEIISHLSASIDTWSDSEILARMLDGQRLAVACVEAALPAIAEAAEAIAQRIRNGGKLYYAGAGSSIRIGVQDGTELPATYGIDEGQLGYLIAGGKEAMFDTLADKEDSIEDGRAAGAICTQRDALIAIAASGRTPFTLAALEEAKANGAFTIAVINATDSALGQKADVEVLLNSGAEVIAGSTRMAAGTAQKAALNFISSLVGIKLGAVHDGMMVAMMLGNEKLKDRAARIVDQITGSGLNAAREALAKTDQIKPAVLLCAGASSAAEATKLLNSNDGNLRRALAQLSQTTKTKLQH
ncbi:N-acetylmuramic acid 6-phosphate etherase [Aestuariivirga litoralis]|uniref:N-acetylmuramic acid 6-phosphate etherase n=1 Tax=Aestuariivirga litoralis TaxID=2650924 RepID=UPI0018C547E8|nr:N-acetylmuramic acid 6-phosphate etherase [Aestuariivirga litoralis]MBG1233874.1 N-acetylmuramic acid 6-phosphate etherase [Aestuariivirga litoralis]